MHDNAIHDLALAGWSEWRSRIKRAAVKTNLADGESCLRMVLELRDACPQSAIIFHRGCLSCREWCQSNTGNQNV